MSSHPHPHPHPRLPLECLQLIIHHIADKNDLLTLTTLLRVNRYVCEATLPFLYNDPFKHSYHSYHSDKTEQLNSRCRLAQTLLRQAPPERISDLVRAAIMDWPVEGDETNKSVQPSTPMPQQPPTNHDDKSKEAYPPPVVNYLSHIRHLYPNCLDDWDAYCDCTDDWFLCCDCLEKPDIPAHIKKYMDDHNLADELHHKSINCLSKPSDAPIYVVHDLQELIKADLQWALCNPDQVQSLRIPLSHIKRNLNCVQDFKALSSVEFDIYDDDNVEVSPELLNRMSTEDQAYVEQIQQEAFSNMQDMIRFIEKHTSHHKDVLQLVDCLSTRDVITSSLFTEDLQIQLFRCLPPLLNPQHLDSRNWRQLLARFEDTNLECVESIKPPWDWRSGFGTFADTFLRRCRSLKSLDWIVERCGDFQWAVDEKRQHDADLAKGLVPKPLVPLRTIDFRCRGINPGREIDDAAIAFGDTLESLKMNIFGGNVSKPQMRFGQGWHLPRLSLLELKLEYGTLHIAPEALVGCRSLVNLDLGDDLMEYDHHQVQSWLPSEHPFLKEIVLVGTPALSFHPDTLHTTPNLNYLSLRMGSLLLRNHYIPPAEELEAGLDNSNNNNNNNNNNSVDGAQGQEDQPSTYPSRPRWTWDWHLPNLTKLDLDAEFAYRFQFRMLQKCSRLEKLTLNMSTSAETHGRVVTLHDLSSGEGYMKLPRLKHFHIAGEWHMENEVLRVLFHEVAPNIRDLNMRDCIGFDLNGWVEAASGLRQLKISYCSLGATKQQLKDVGLESSVEPYVQDQENTHIAGLSFSGVHLCNVRRFPAV